MSTAELRVAVAGAGAYAAQHLRTLTALPDSRVVLLVEPSAERAAKASAEHGVPQTVSDLSSALVRDDVDAIVLATPSPQHVEQALAVLRAGKHVLVEVPLALELAGARAVAEAQRETGQVAMVGHVRRFNASHAWMLRRLRLGELTLQHLVVQTLFMRRDNTNAAGEPRDWTDHLLWHHAAHTVDLFAVALDEPVEVCGAIAGPLHPALGIATEMSLQLRSESGVLCTVALSFDHDGPWGSTFRYICDRGTYVASYDALVDGHGELVDLLGARDGIEAQDAEFVAASLAGRPCRSSATDVLGAYELLDQAERMMRGRCATTST